MQNEDEDKDPIADLVATWDNGEKHERDEFRRYQLRAVENLIAEFTERCNPIPTDELVKHLPEDGDPDAPLPDDILRRWQASFTIDSLGKEQARLRRQLGIRQPIEEKRAKTRERVRRYRERRKEEKDK